jgi:uncharacterized protein (DUF169 family)
MVWKQYAKTLTEVLKLEGRIVSVSYTFDAPPVKRPKSCRACFAMDQVHKGESVILDVENSSCGGGTWHLGLGGPPQGKAAEGLKRFLVDGEKLVCSYAAFHRMAALATPPPKDVASTIVMQPMDEAVLEPDVAVFYVNAEQACRLITLHTFFTGRTPRAELIGSHCHMAIAYSLVSNEVNVSFGDWTARQMIRSDQALCWVTVPYYHLPGIIAAIPRCTAGTAEGRPASDYMSG